MIIQHKVNRIEDLKRVPSKYGVEVDVRGHEGKLFLSHDPIINPENHDGLNEYLQNFNNAFIIFNVKEAGYEKDILKLADKHNLQNYFLLDIEFPYLYHATKEGITRNLAIRYSEAESIETVKLQIKEGNPLLNWVWVDTITKLPLTAESLKTLLLFKTCLVCPERWGRPEEIKDYIKKIRSLGYVFDAVMTSKDYISQWEGSGVVR